MRVKRKGWLVPNRPGDAEYTSHQRAKARSGDLHSIEN